MLASYLGAIKENKVRITAGSFLIRFKEKEASVFLEHLVKLGVGKRYDKLEENAARQLKRYILWAIGYKYNKTSVKPTEQPDIVPEPSL
mgnify:FL=1